MKKKTFILLITLSILLSTTTNLLAINGNMGGPTQDGSEAFPYLIEDFNDFQVFCANSIYSATDKHTRLDCDLDLDPNLPGREIYTTAPIASDTDNTNDDFEGSPFDGIFDGNNHIISNLTINTAGAGNDHLGLFGQIGSSGAEIRYLAMVGVNITGGNYSQYLGGLCGYNDQGLITTCYATGRLTGGSYSKYFGGMCGKNNAGNITNCYATSKISGGDYSWYLGGMCGENWDGSIINCYSTGPITSGTNSDRLGGFCGRNYAGNITNCFWDIETSSRTYSSGGTGKTTLEMQDMSTFTDEGWDFVGENSNGINEIWQIPTAGGYPVLSSFYGYVPVILSGDGSQNNPYLISNAAELGAMHYYSQNAFYRLENDIDLTGIKWSNAVVPVFGGFFDGNDHEIYNLNIEGGGNLGLFGMVTTSGAEIKNLGIIDVNITGTVNSNYLGGLCGYNNANIINCYATGEVSSGDNSLYLGGLCGYNDQSSFTNCHTNIKITSGVGSDYIGGLCGYHGSSSITNCYANGEVTGDDYIGGLCGVNDEGSITDCYATGNIIGDNSRYSGGLCGRNLGSIKNCYTTGDVTCNVGSDRSGGLCGSSSGSITSCYTTGTVTGDSTLGGLCGDASGNIINCYTNGGVKGYWAFGGLCGYYTTGTISNCYATGAITGKYRSSDMGGLCGYLENGSIVSCYATGEVNGEDRSKDIGGLCGSNREGRITNCYATGNVGGGDYSEVIGGLSGHNSYGTITNCYATGKVTGSTDLGGFCGYNYQGIINNCFWDIQTSNIFWSSGGTPFYTDSMQTQSTFTDAGWDFVGEEINDSNDIWRMCVDGVDYPRLWWEFTAGDFDCPNGVNFTDFVVMADTWSLLSDQPGYNEKCDLNYDDTIDFADLAIFINHWLEGVEPEVDNDPPTPNPSQWVIWPCENSGYHIMSAVIATDSATGGNDPVWYKFEVVAGFGMDSQWQLSNEYIYLHSGNVAYTVITCDSIPQSNPPQPNQANSTALSEPAATYE